MALRKEPINPFYPLLVLAGVAFAVTACAYGVMALKAMSPNVADEKHPLMVFLDQHGMLLLGGELAALGVTCVLAMATDGYWSRRGADRSPPDETSADRSSQHE